MSPHFPSDHDALTMGSLIVVLVAVAVYCSETCCRTLPVTVDKSESIGLAEGNNNSLAVRDERGSPGEIFRRNLVVSRRKLPIGLEEAKNLVNGTRNETRKSRFLGSLAFLAGLGFGGIATAASSTMKTFAKLPQASFTLNLSPSKTSPYFAAYYNPYSLLPYPFLYSGAVVPTNIDTAKPQTTSHDDLTSQVIDVFDDRPPVVESNEEYEVVAEKSDKSASNDGADHRTELRADRNAEEKIVTRGCKEVQKKHGNLFKGSVREREDLLMDADDLGAALDFQVANTTEANQTVTENATIPMTTTTPPTTIHPTYRPPYVNNYTEYPQFPGYFGGYPQDVSNVDLTTGTDRYYGHNQIKYGSPYERPTNFYHDGKYDVYSSYINPYFPGSLPPEQMNEYADFNRAYPSEYQFSYNSGFRPAK